MLSLLVGNRNAVLQLLNSSVWCRRVVFRKLGALHQRTLDLPRSISLAHHLSLVRLLLVEEDALAPVLRLVDQYLRRPCLRMEVFRKQAALHHQTRDVCRLVKPAHHLSVVRLLPVEELPLVPVFWLVVAWNLCRSRCLRGLHFAVFLN